MTDLPLVSSPPVAAARAPLRTTTARNDAAQANAVPFQDALALELGLPLDGALLPDRDAPAAASSAAMKARGRLENDEKKPRATLSADAPIGDALAGLSPLLPANLAFSQPAGSVAAGRAPAPGEKSPAGTSSSPRTGLANTPLTADIAAPGRFAHAAAAGIAQAPAAQELHSPVATLAADLAVPGRTAAAAAGELHREVAPAGRLLEQQDTAPAPVPTVHGDNAAPVALAQASVATLEARVGDRGWDRGLGDKLVWMAGHGQQVAQLHLNPPDLGPLKITLTLNHDQASAQFVCAHAAVREAIETAMPRLREMLADSGITLGNTNVSNDAFREQAQPQHEPRAYPLPPTAAAADAGTITRGERALRRRHGLVDTFA